MTFCKSKFRYFVIVYFSQSSEKKVFIFDLQTVLQFQKKGKNIWNLQKKEALGISSKKKNNCHIFVGCC